MISYKQPKALYPLFFTELWERFGFYTIQTIFVLYLTQGLLYTDHKAYLLYGAFNSLLYLTPFVGGYLADRFLGMRRAILLGGILLCLGYLLMAFPDPSMLFLGLSLVVVGNGFFKPNVSSIVGSLYKPHDPRREGGFTLFYMGINIGSLLPTLFIGALVAAYSWYWGFGIASLGMIFAVIIFSATQKYLKTHGEIPPSSPFVKKNRGKVFLYLVLGIVGSVALIHFFLQHAKETDFFAIIATLAITGVLFALLYKEKKSTRKKLFASLLLIALSIGFWAIYMQTFTSLLLFAERNVHKELFGLAVNAEFTLFFNPFFIIAFSPLLNRVWTYLEVKKLNPSIPCKFSLGILCIAIGFLGLAWGVSLSSTGESVSIWWLIMSYFIQTMGELLLSPIGLAMITKLAPKHMVSTLMGIWFLTLSTAFALGGQLATFADVPKGSSPTTSLAIYDHAFTVYGLIALVLACISFVLMPYINKLLKFSNSPIATLKE